LRCQSSSFCICGLLSCRSWHRIKHSILLAFALSVLHCGKLTQYPNWNLSYILHCFIKDVNLTILWNYLFKFIFIDWLKYFFNTIYILSLLQFYLSTLTCFKPIKQIPIFYYLFNLLIFNSCLIFLSLFELNFAKLIYLILTLFSFFFFYAQLCYFVHFEY